MAFYVGYGWLNVEDDDGDDADGLCFLFCWNSPQQSFQKIRWFLQKRKEKIYKIQVSKSNLF